MAISTKTFLAVLITLLHGVFLFAQQIPDSAYHPKISEIHFKNCKSRIFIDEAHHNFHTGDDRYGPFASLLRRHGCDITSSTNGFSAEHLKNMDVLIIANALHASNNVNWNQPNPSAFTKEEIENVKKWIYEGGRLFLIADHMPFSGAASELAASFGFTFYNGFLIDTLNKINGDLFCLADNSLVRSKLTESVDSIYSFTGQAFDIPSSATAVLTCDERFVLMMPDRAWEFTSSTKIISPKGKCQLATLTYGKGKIVVSGEAAMFTAQLSNGKKVGMNSNHAKNNAKFLLRLIEWLCA